MEYKEGHAGIPCGKIPDRASGNPDCPHGIVENEFPCMDRCFRKSAAVPGDVYETLCPHCSVWTSLPEGSALKVAHIFDCMVCGYGKRMTEGDK